MYYAVFTFVIMIQFYWRSLGCSGWSSVKLRVYSETVLFNSYYGSSYKVKFVGFKLGFSCNANNYLPTHHIRRDNSYRLILLVVTLSVASLCSVPLIFWTVLKEKQAFIWILQTKTHFLSVFCFSSQTLP